MEVLAGKVAVYHEALPDTHAIDAAELLMAVEFSSRKGNAHTARPSQAIFLPSQYTIQAFGNLGHANQSRAILWRFRTMSPCCQSAKGQPHVSHSPTRELGTLESLFWTPDDCLWMGEMGFSWSTRFSVSPPKPSAMPLVSGIALQSTRNSHALRCTRLSNTAVHTAARLGPLFSTQMSHRSHHMQ